MFDLGVGQVAFGIDVPALASEKAHQGEGRKGRIRIVLVLLGIVDEEIEGGRRGRHLEILAGKTVGAFKHLELFLSLSTFSSAIGDLSLEKAELGGRDDGSAGPLNGSSDFPTCSTFSIQAGEDSKHAFLHVEERLIADGIGNACNQARC